MKENNNHVSECFKIKQKQRLHILINWSSTTCSFPNKQLMISTLQRIEAEGRRRFELSNSNKTAVNKVSAASRCACTQEEAGVVDTWHAGLTDTLLFGVVSHHTLELWAHSALELYTHCTLELQAHCALELQTHCTLELQAHHTLELQAHCALCLFSAFAELSQH